MNIQIMKFILTLSALVSLGCMITTGYVKWVMSFLSLLEDQDILGRLDD